MSKVALITENTELSGPVTGRWVWKDDTNTLEFLSNNPNADKQDKRRKAKADKNRSDRVASSTTRPMAMGRGRSQPLPGHSKSPHPSKKDNVEHLTVSLLDIKDVAHDLITEGTVEHIPDAFLSLYKTDQFDGFLVHLLSYFNCFFEKMNQENKKNPMYIEPSLSEKKAYANACARMEVAQQHLGQFYCVLVLGLGLESYHHMCCGRSRVSSTHKDKSMFEAFYTFCTYVVWITFRRKEFEVVKKEIGRMLRSDTFNPAIRVKYAPDEPKEDLKKDNKKTGETKDATEQEEKLTPAEYRRLHPRRPAIKSIINQRSPAVVSILPSPKEESHWLFKRTGALSPTSLANASRGGNIGRDQQDARTKQSAVININKFKVGILGEPYNQFNPRTLTPIGAENEEENEGDGNADLKTSGDDCAQGLNPDSGLSRQQTALSHATTEVQSDDE